MERVRGTCVSLDGVGVLLRGPSGSGKSDLALRLLDGGANLVSDDYTEVLTDDDGRIFASAPDRIEGLLEVRGLGVVRLPCDRRVPLVAVVDLSPARDVERMPAGETAVVLGRPLPLFRLHAFEPSAAAKVRLAVRLSTGGIMLAR